jgi:hypothetical protein
MDIPQEVWVAGGVAVLLIIVICVLFILQRRRVDFTHSKSPGQKPEWLRTSPPEETVAATQADGEGVTLYDHDKGERMASAFVEQIEDVLRARLQEDSLLAAMDVDFGTAPDGRLEVWVDGERYVDIDLIPNAHLREVIRQAVASWKGA